MVLTLDFHMVSFVIYMHPLPIKAIGFVTGVKKHQLPSMT